MSNNQCIRYLHTILTEIEVGSMANIYLRNTSIPVRIYEKLPGFGNGSTMSSYKKNQWQICI